mmetsp:Transcript_21471/g.46537  ORF Transcript_21471/g.46537 Transcript_21471/m.46537 type:complete len:549 (-) Transcript_21471:107-1753(-)|eukprot:CAMPEP_0173263220 /NCGR_PEP_ID=MMETSP1142-20121109/27234_1 /TAXON_ID=483371 /ORGANISM="non described non described, Strain CCMP2298" /LENGTH=548 /DNA_ID=CAMNT_0014198495 /DNA_START=277 /DNA_END=1923 /DNA_ORIENTATION=-
MAETTCRVFYPLAEDLRDLKKYVEELEKIHPDMGICKMVPPIGWYRREYDLDTMVIPIQSPIKQSVEQERGGVSHVTNYILKATDLQKFRKSSEKAEDVSEMTLGKRERQFWKRLGKGREPVYGADFEGTLFDPSLASSDMGLEDWTLASGLKDLLRRMPHQVGGVNTPMLYVGEWRALFALHVEDMDLYSINYLHTGAPKSWYSIRPSLRARFENLAKSYFAEDYLECHEYLRHKTKLLSPTKLRDNSIEYETVVQHAGEFVVTFPSAYHMGYNHGINIAEATNFATRRWLAIGRKAKTCICHPGAVRLDMEELEQYQREEDATLGLGDGGSSSSSGGSGAPSSPRAEAPYWLAAPDERKEVLCPSCRSVVSADLGGDSCSMCTGDRAENRAGDRVEDRAGDRGDRDSSRDAPSLPAKAKRGRCKSKSVWDVDAVETPRKAKGLVWDVDDPPPPKRVKKSRGKEAWDGTLRGIKEAYVPLKINDIVVVVREGSSDEEVDDELDKTVGVITSIEDTKGGKIGRVHVKGKQRDSDRWVPLRKCHLQVVV